MFVEICLIFHLHRFSYLVAIPWRPHIFEQYVIDGIHCAEFASSTKCTTSKQIHTHQTSINKSPRIIYTLSNVIIAILALKSWVSSINSPWKRHENYLYILNAEFFFFIFTTHEIFWNELITHDEGNPPWHEEGNEIRRKEIIFEQDMFIQCTRVLANKWSVIRGKIKWNGKCAADVMCKYLSEKCKFIHFSISMMKKCTYLSVTQFFSPFFMRKIPKWFFLSRSFVQFGMSDEKIKYEFRELQATIGVQLHCYISWNKREREKHNV